ncbi:C40 family peptidase, partial [bacterium]|nr:C40 family peptidase [bacterium]
GGRSLESMDCSGMIQRIFMDQNLLLPKNSRDQRKCGIRISLNNSIPGDLIFAIGKEKKLHHVAICLRNGIQHACLSKGHILCESLADFTQKYRIIAVRRIVKLA